MRLTLTVSIAATSLAIGLASLPSTSEAQGVVTACSRFGKGCISGPTRPARFGREVRMPGGTWLPCAGDCRRTLADETVDFWAKREAERAFGRGGRR